VAAGTFRTGSPLRDLAAVNTNDNTVSVLLGNGDGTFLHSYYNPSLATDYPTGGSNPTAIAVGTFRTGSNIRDLVVTNGGYNNYNVAVLFGNGNGTFQSPFIVGTFPADPGSFQFPIAVAVGDFNGDGNQDVAVGWGGPGAFSGGVSVWYGNGFGMFQPKRDYLVVTAVTALAAGDFNNDGKDDLAATNFYGGISVLRSNGPGFDVLPPISTGGTRPTAVAVGDFNGDGRRDLAVTNGDANTVGVLLGNGDCTFQFPITTSVGFQPTAVAVDDFDRDGRLDLAVANRGSNGVTVLLGNGDGSFHLERNYPVGSVGFSPSSVAAADFNGDGRPDLAVAISGSRYVSVLLNGGPGFGFASLRHTDNLSTVNPTVEPPDTNAAAGPTHIVEVVNRSIAFYDKTTQTRVFLRSLDDFFAPVGPGTPLFDPVVAYDELGGRFIVAAADRPGRSFLDLAVSNDADPTHGFTRMYRIDVTESTQPGLLVDFPKIGWNADAIVVSLNMYTSAAFDHVQVVTIAKSMLYRDPPTLITYQVDRLGGLSSHITMVPAKMHGAVAGGPMWFVEEAGFASGTTLRVVQMTNVLSATPTFTDFDIPVASYGGPPYPNSFAAPQRGGGYNIDAGFSWILSTAWRGDRLVASQTVDAGGVIHARWYEFNTGDVAPTLTQSGDIDQGPGVYTYYPSIDIAANGDLGMTFMESSDSEYMSMYVVGQTLADPRGVMEPPLLVKAGEANYIGFRAGDYSGITVDPLTNTSFWAANEYATGTDNAYYSHPPNWGTWIAPFSVGGSGGGGAGASGGNFNGDGKLDISWYNMATGQFNPWLMDSLTFLKRGVAGTASDRDLKITQVDELFAANAENRRGAFARARPNLLRPTDGALLEGFDLVIGEGDGRTFQEGLMDEAALARIGSDWESVLCI
jgi:hypothetical protein